jgi:hypothetical protein
MSHWALLLLPFGLFLWRAEGLGRAEEFLISHDIVCPVRKGSESNVISGQSLQQIFSLVAQWPFGDVAGGAIPETG